MILRSIANSTGKAIAAYTKTLNDASKLCFGAAAGCFVVGTLGWIANFFVAKTTMLHGLLVVAVFYLVLGGIKLFEKQAANPIDIDQKCDLNDQQVSNDRIVQPKKRVKSAA